MSSSSSESSEELPSSSSEDFSSSSSESSSSSSIEFVDQLKMLTNPNASDFGLIELPILNPNMVSFATVEKEGAFPLSISAWTLTSVTVQADLGVPLAGKSSESVTFKFKDAIGGVIDSASIKLEVGTPVKHLLKTTVDGYTFGLDFSGTFQTGFEGKAGQYTWTDVSAPTNVGLAIKTYIDGGSLDADISANFKASIDGASPDDVTIAFGLTGTLTLSDFNLGSVNATLAGNYGILWDDATGNATKKASLSMTFRSGDTDAKKWEFDGDGLSLYIEQSGPLDKAGFENTTFGLKATIRF